MRIKFVQVLVTTGIIAALAGQSESLAQERLEVMHWWTSGGESKALSVLTSALKEEGVEWQDSAVAGSAGTNLLQVLQARLAAGDPPAAMQLHGQQIRSYANEGILLDLTDFATAGKWDEILAPELQAFAKIEGKYFGIPFDEHRGNWMWVNKPLLDKYGGEVTAPWEERFFLADKMKADGITPLAHGFQAWQELELWENILIGVGGANFHKSALSELRPDALDSDTMRETFETYRRVIRYSPQNAANLDWNPATQMVIRGEAAFQIQGDWAKGEFKLAGKQAGVDYICTVPPGHEDTFLFLADYWGFFPPKNEAVANAQKKMAELAVNTKVQTEFNKEKGSIPTISSVNPSDFDECAQKGIKDRQNALAEGKLLPSLGENHAQPREVRGVFEDVVNAYARDPSMTAQQAIDNLKNGLAQL
ncbi:carbohydrate ABC transporter substrate-binding protein [Mesorhizobium sp. M7A.F.Ca.US.011.01.1.1]|uniref:ABC transporter substrate-binding protein n=1 Tax=Mesorhizobium sp. M7A.F.Ca.US.011.01.1.1 TaxID=2496741 RepID=UPI000FCC3669|nr:ABC transporter substrate-binding protein [Mesorhizobium sp. M7A.F.Ca.US.011.01.1.1]RUX21281.1 carbohydrate ABC transporter substrate-binding protein [Mesorhizobium sp. M7A.F.Ca.US.011.01.1.1]